MRPATTLTLGLLLADARRPIGALPDVVVPVQLARGRFAERGFNQATDLARPLPLPLEHALTRDFQRVRRDGVVVERSSLCSADPLCAEHVPESSEDTLHNASCHACLFVPETTCERGNRYLDLATLVRTLSVDQIEFFRL